MDDRFFRTLLGLDFPGLSAFHKNITNERLFHFLQASERSLLRIRGSRRKISPARWVWTRPKMPNV